MKNGFTLIELLAAIIILAIIALIAVPIVLNIINDTKERAFEQSINGIVKSATLKASIELKNEDILYKYENNNWVENKLNIDGETPKYVEIKVNKKGQVRYAITDGSYCATKEYDSKINIKKIGNENNNKKIEEQYCKLDAKIPTDTSCFQYTETSDSIKITDYYCYEGNTNSLTVVKDLIIPENINGKVVTSIGMNAFYSKGLTSVIIPDSVTSMGAQAFCDNELTNVTIPKNITSISDSLFRENKLTSIEIPNTITSIFYGAFADNKLISIEIPSSVTYIESAAFVDNQLPDDEAFIYNRKNNGEIDYTSLNSYGGKNRENVRIPEGITYIGESSFARCDIKNITISNSVTSIGYYAFGGNKLESIEIPTSVKKIGDYAFSGNYSKTIEIQNGVEEIGNWAFSYNKLTSITIPESVTNIGDYAFNNVIKYLTKVTIEGKSSISDFDSFGTNVFSWKDTYSDSNITWEGSN